jgi:hypothetical protein
VEVHHAKSTSRRPTIKVCGLLFVATTLNCLVGQMVGILAPNIQRFHHCANYLAETRRWLFFLSALDTASAHRRFSD